MSVDSLGDILRMRGHIDALKVLALAIPPSNDVDVFAHCCGFIAIIEGGKLVGYNVTVGGGLGFTHNNQKTRPRLAEVIGFCELKDCRYVTECVMT